MWVGFSTHEGGAQLMVKRQAHAASRGRTSAAKTKAKPPQKSKAKPKSRQKSAPPQAAAKKVKAEVATKPSGFFDEMLGNTGTARVPYRQIAEWMQTLSKGTMAKKQEEADAIFRRLGITFAVYGESGSNERLIPFDLIPRIISAKEWRYLERGIEQRVRALNAFLYDIYHRQEIIRAGRIPAAMINGNAAFLPEMIGFDPPRKIYSHIIGTDLVRTGENEFFVLEDNLRTPSGVSYMLENREAMMHLFPELFSAHRVAPVERYPELLRQTLESVAPSGCNGDPTIAVLTPGIYNSAYFEHSF